MLCVQQYLGIGYVIVKSQSQFIYSNFKEEYACSVSGPIYQCTKNSIENWDRGTSDNKK